MDVKTVLSFIAAIISLRVSLCGGDADHPLYLLDLYDCIDDYEDYCHDIPEFTIRAAIELANNRKDILPGYILHTSNATSSPVGSIKSGEVMFIVQSFSYMYVAFLGCICHILCSSQVATLQSTVTQTSAFSNWSHPFL